MKEDKVKQFMKSHQQKIDDDGFTTRLSNQLNTYPSLKKANKRTFYIALIVPVFFLLAVILVGLLGGWDILLINMKYTRLHGINSLWYALSSLILIFMSALTLFTLNWKETY